MRKVFGIFKIKSCEKWLAIVSFVVFAVLNALVIGKYFDKFSPVLRSYHWLFIKVFHISGFDPLTYEVVSKWAVPYEIHRHPLLAFFMYLPNQINQGLIMLTGVNCAQFVVAVILIFCALYSVVFMFRIFREVMALCYCDAMLLTIFTFSFAYILIAAIVPDHFIMSMFMLILTVYISGKKMVKHQLLTKWQTVLFFIFTAGISLNNGIKVFLASLFTNGKRFFNPLNLLFAVILPASLMWVFAQCEYQHFQYPKDFKRKIIRERMAKWHEQKVYKMFRDTTSLTDSAEISKQVKVILNEKALTAYRAKQKIPAFAHQGEPIKKQSFLSWTDVTTPRMATVINNLFGESIILHGDYLLEDTLTGRPVIVPYKWIFNYIVEAVVVLLIAAGIWFGRRSRFLWLALSFFLFDMLLHIGLGFGINEVYIMSPHWMFVFGIAVAYLFKLLKGKTLATLRYVVAGVAAYLFIYNVSLITSYLVR